MTKQIKIFYSLVIFFTFFNINTTYPLASTNSHELNTEDVNNLKEELNKIRESSQNFETTFDSLKTELKEIQQEAEAKKKKNINFLNNFKNFKNKKLYEIQVAKLGPFPIKFSVYGEDVLRLPILAAEILNDKNFYDNFINSYNDLALEKILENSEDFIDFLAEDPKFIDVHRYITKNQKINTFSLFKTNLTQNLSHFVIAESLRVIKDKAFKDRIISLGEGAKEFIRNPILRLMYGQPIRAYQLLEIYLSMPKETAKYDIYLTNLVLQGFEILYSTSTHKKPGISKFLKYYRGFLNSYGFILFKEIFALKTTLDSLDKNVYSKKRAIYTVKNKDAFMETLIKYQNLKNKYPKRTKISNELFAQAENEIKKHLKKAHNLTFKNWLRNKNALYSSQKIIINWVASIPMYAFMIKSIFNYYRGKRT